jgi:hypothetical protein
MGKRFIITEEEKSNILGLYGRNETLLNEEDGTYTLKNKTNLIRTSLGGAGTLPYRITLKQGAIIRKSGSNIIIPKESIYYYDEDTKKSDGKFYVDGKLACKGSESINFGENASYKYETNIPGTYDTFAETLRNKLCKKSVSKTPETTKSPVKIKLPDLTEKNFCNLSGDKVWEYAKLDDGTWYTRKKGQEEWTKLELPKFQKAVDLLNKDGKCGSLETVVIGTLPLKPIEPLPINTPTDIIKPE